jgi:2-oxoglutarate ferredoxin oxidoreductase subunit gamma
MAVTEIKFGGMGGQGVILGGVIVGKAAALYDSKHSCLTQVFGPEARGSACSAQVVMDSNPILYPYVHHPHFLVAMSQEAFNKFAPEVRADATILIEEDLVKVSGLPPTVKVYGVPATRYAEELGRKMVLNIVMVGFFAAISGTISEKAARESVADSVPPNTIDLNMKAFDKGFKHGKDLLAKKS